MRRFINNQLNTAIQTFKRLDYSISSKLVEECLSCVGNGGKIITTAIGKNAPICEKFVGTLNSLDISSHFLNSNTAFHGDLGIIKTNDLVIIMSKSGETGESIDIAKILKKRKINCWLITCNKNCTITKHIHKSIILPIKHEGDKWDLIPNNSTLVFLIFLQSLALKLSHKLVINIDILKKNHPGGGIGKRLKKR
ncbi:MAG: SIS domain-containing protein [Microgenomates group bacterium]